LYKFIHFQASFEKVSLSITSGSDLASLRHIDSANPDHLFKPPQTMGICGRELAYTFILALGSLTFGYVMGYYSPAHVSMIDEWGDVIKDSTFGWFNSVTSLTAILGPFITNFLVTPNLPFGRKITCFIIALASTTFWLLFLGLSSDHFWLGILARALLGLGIGAFSALVPMYVIELAPPEATGFFGTIPQICVSGGFVVVFLFSQWMDWRKVAICGAAITGACALLVWLVPQVTAKQAEGPTESPFKAKYAARLIVGSLLSLFQQLSGINAILTNLTDLFKNANVSLEPNYASALSSSAQVIATIAASFLIQKFGRKIMWVISFGGIAITDLLYGLTEFKKFKDAKTFGPVFPIVVIFLNLLAFGTGAGPIPWFIVPEMFEDAPAARAPATSFVSSLNWIFAFGVVELFPYMKKGLGLGWSFIFFAIASTIATIFGLFYVKADAKAGARTDGKADGKELYTQTDPLYTNE
jgi:MFS family permease